MPDGREGVVLGAEGNMQRAGARSGGEGGWEPADAARNLEAGGVEGLCTPGRCVLLLEGDLGMRVDAVAQRDQRLAGCLKTLTRRRFGINRAPRSTTVSARSSNGERGALLDAARVSLYGSVARGSNGGNGA